MLSKFNQYATCPRDFIYYQRVAARLVINQLLLMPSLTPLSTDTILLNYAFPIWGKHAYA